MSAVMTLDLRCKIVQGMAAEPGVRGLLASQEKRKL